MLPLTLALALLAQHPGPVEAWGTARSGSGGAASIAVSGTLELTRGEAEAAALAAAEARHRAHLVERAEALVKRLAPFWLPAFLRRGEVEAWVRQAERSTPLRVLRSETETHTYSYGEAYRTTVHVAREAGREDPAAEARLERRLREAGRLLLAKGGGIAVFWGLLAFVCSWLDRLSRGYMTGRLRLIALALGLAVPAVVLLV